LSHGSGLYGIPNVAKAAANVILKSKTFDPKVVFETIQRDGGGRWFKNKFLKKWAIWISLYKVRLNPCPLLFDVKFKEAFKNSLHNNRWARCFL